MRALQLIGEPDPLLNIRSKEALEKERASQWSSDEWLYYFLTQETDDMDPKTQRGLCPSIERMLEVHDINAKAWEWDKLAAQLENSETKESKELVEEFLTRRDFYEELKVAVERLREWDHEMFSPYFETFVADPLPATFWMPGTLVHQALVYDCDSGKMIRHVHAVDFEERKIYGLQPIPHPGYEWRDGQVARKSRKWEYEVEERSWGETEKPGTYFKLVEIEGDFCVRWANGEPPEAIHAYALLCHRDEKRGKFPDEILEDFSEERGKKILEFLKNQQTPLRD